MKRVLLSTIVLASIAAAPALAADIPTKAPVYKAAPIAAAPWTGFYVGAQLGGGWADWDTSVFTSAVGPAFIAGFPIGNVSGSGIVGGVHAGYNHQISNLVFGVEGDITWTGIDGSRNYVVPGIGAGLPFTLKNSIDYYGTIRGKLGLVWNRSLLYVTGGYAWAKSDSTITSPGQIAGPFTTTDSHTHHGWTLGVGGDYMITPNWIASVQYKYLDLGSATYIYQFPLAPVTGSTKLTISEVTARVSYKF